LTIKFARANSVSTTGFLIRLVNHRYSYELKLTPRAQPSAFSSQPLLPHELIHFGYRRPLNHHYSPIRLSKTTGLSKLMNKPRETRFKQAPGVFGLVAEQGTSWKLVLHRTGAKAWWR